MWTNYWCYTENLLYNNSLLNKLSLGCQCLYDYDQSLLIEAN